MYISNSLYEDFRKMWNGGHYSGLRYGQAFYNHFSLHKAKSTINNKWWDTLYNTHFSQAETMILSIIDWEN